MILCICKQVCKSRTKRKMLCMNWNKIHTLYNKISVCNSIMHLFQTQTCVNQSLKSNIIVGRSSDFEVTEKNRALWAFNFIIIDLHKEIWNL